MAEVSLKELSDAATEGLLFVHDFAHPEVSSDPSPADVTLSCDHPATITLAYMGRAMTATLEEARANAAYLCRLWTDHRAGRLHDAAALAEAEARGMRAGIERAAKVASADAGELYCSTSVATAERIMFAIRALATAAPAETEERA